MDGFCKEIIRRLPLAESVTQLFRAIAKDDLLSEVWATHRGRCYERELSFTTMVQLIADALLCSRSGRDSFRRSKEEGTLGTSIQAVYDKLGRLPIRVSEGFLERSTLALREVFPDWSTWKLPASLRGTRVVIYDGKSVKRVAHRLKLTRSSKGGLLGGRALVVQDWETGMAVSMYGDPDGESNDVKHLGKLVPRVREIIPGPLLHVGDCAFCDLVQPKHFQSSPDDHFLVRYHPKVKFHRDFQVSERVSSTEAGETVTDRWGWMGSEKDARRIYVRQIELHRENDKSIILITTLLDADESPAVDLLFVYRNRWGIEHMFQEVTEVFGLSHLIGTAPQATLFQFAFCLLLYNMIQVVRGYIAQARQLDPNDISPELLFRDVEEELISCHKMLTSQQIEERFADVLTPAQLKCYLTRILGSAWSDRWLASPNRNIRTAHPGKRKKSHTSVFRLLYGVPPKNKSRHYAVRIPKSVKTSPPKRS
jgi:hypothetical protein